MPPPGRIGAYEILGVLGRGGMGVVYKARQDGVGRIVALKMLLAGPYADPDQLDRFRREAEAVGRLRHGNVVQIYEVGRHDGRPYFSVEYLPGGSLAERLRGEPQPAEASARLVQTLAGAVHAIHKAGVVHRDLKPANVLLADDGTPKVADFGLAKCVDNPTGGTQPGAILGTPSYMAPEQAGGQTAEAGPAADVYALGAILYELLAGRPPHRGATLLDTLELVRTAEPVPPRQLRPDLPRDLETICLKCLRKEPEQRYHGADALAEDLRRWLEGEPIVARPVGAAARLAKWARRRPAVAGLLAAVVFLLLGGGGLTAYLVLEAQAAQTSAANARANAADERALRSEGEAAAADAAREQSEAAQARLLAELLGDGEGPVNRGELKALWSLSRTTNDRVRLLVFERALADQDGARMLGRRAGLAAQAGAGLSGERRERLLALVLKRWSEGDGTPEQQQACVALGATLEMRDEAFAREATRFALEEMKRPGDPASLRRRAETVAALARGLNVEEAGRASREAGQPILEAVARTNNPPDLKLLAQAFENLSAGLTPDQAAALADPGARPVLDAMVRLNVTTGEIELRAQVLAALAARLPPERASALSEKAAQIVLDAMMKNFFAAWRGPFQRVLRPLAAHLTSEQAARLARQIIESELRKNADLEPELSSSLIPVLDVLGPRIGPPEADRIAAAVIAALENRSGPADLPVLGRVFRILAARLDAGRAKELYGQGVEKFAKALGRPVRGQKFAEPRRQDLLGGLAAELTAEQAARGARILLEDMAGTADPYCLNYQAQGLAVLAGRLSSDQAEALTAKGAQLILDALAKPLNAGALSQLTVALEALAARLGPELAARCARTVSEAIPQAKFPGDVHYLAGALAALAPRLPPEPAAECARKVLAAMTKQATPGILSDLATALAALAERLDPPQGAENATAGARVLLDKLRDTSDPLATAVLARGLGGLAPLLGPKRAAEVEATVVQRLIEVFPKTQGPASVSNVYRRLEAITPRLTPEQAVQCAAAVYAALTRTTSMEERAELTRLLGIVATRLDPEQAARIATPALAALSANDADLARVDGAALALAAVAPVLSPDRATRCAGAVLDMWPRVPEGKSILNDGTHTSLALALVKLSEKVGDQDAVELLKHPCCAGSARDILDAELGKRVRQKWDSHWEMIEWLRRHRPDLDLESLPHVAAERVNPP
jgi:hypothetical protein